MTLSNVRMLIAMVMVGIVSTSATRPVTVPVQIVNPQSLSLLSTSNRSQLFSVTLPANASYLDDAPPYVLTLRGTRFQIGYDYAALMANQTSFTLQTFMNSLTTNASQQQAFLNFSDYLWNAFYVTHIPQGFLTELEGMAQWYQEQPAAIRASLLNPPQDVSRHFFVLANMPADLPNIISALEREWEHGWPLWLKEVVNDIIWVIEHLGHHCDAYGVWGSRTVSGRLYTSRNLDYNSDTGINRYKLLLVFEVQESNGTQRIPYVSMGFSFGLGALAGMNMAGITTSEMNLDNSETTFSGLPFPLRLRYVLERATDLHSAMALWNATNNTNSFNFLIGSAADTQAFALETIRDFTAIFPANSPVEAAAFYPCGVPPNEDHTCKGWTNETGDVRIGFPLPEAVWRTNHGMNPVVMATQEPLFNDTVFRYNLMHDLFVGFEAANVSIGDTEAVEIVATLGTKGSNFLTCDQVLDGSNVLSVAYVPGEHRFFVAWENGHGAAWRPAACSPYVAFDLQQLL